VLGYIKVGITIANMIKAVMTRCLSIFLPYVVEWIL
jgi:hypothetical protein